MYLPTRQNTVLSYVKNVMGKMTVKVARRPSIDNESRGQFDDVLFVQLARARFANLAMEAAEKSIQAPMVVPHDVSLFLTGLDQGFTTLTTLPFSTKLIDLYDFFGMLTISGLENVAEGCLISFAE